MENYIIPQIANIILGLLMSLFLMAVLKRKYGPIVTFAGTMAFVSLSIFGLLLLPANTMFLIKQSLSCLVILSGAMLFYSDKLSRKVLAVIFIYVGEWICELVGVMLCSSVLTSTSDVFTIAQSEQIVMYTVYVVLYAGLMYFTAMVINRMAGLFSWKEMVLFSLLPLSQLAMIIWSLAPGWYQNNVAVRAAAALFCIISDVCLYFAIKAMSQIAELKAKNQLLAEQIEADKAHYSALTDHYESIRRLRHDIANHLYTMQALVESGETQQAARYVKELIPRHTFRSSLGQCENPVVDAFLFSRINRIKEAGITFEGKIQLPYDNGIANADLIIALGNMLDNAEEACRVAKAGNKNAYISLSACEENGFCIFRLENSAPALPAAARPRIQGMSRGVGNTILEQLAEQYHGSFVAGMKNGLYCTMLTLKTLR